MRYVLLMTMLLAVGCADKHYDTFLQPIVEAESEYANVRPGVWFDMEYDQVGTGWVLVGYKKVRGSGRVEQWRWVEGPFVDYEMTDGSRVKLRDPPHWTSETIDSVDVSWWYEQG